MTRHDLPDLVVEALKAMGGAGRIVQICKYIWEHHNDALQGICFTLGSMTFAGRGSASETARCWKSLALIMCGGSERKNSCLSPHRGAGGGAAGHDARMGMATQGHGPGYNVIVGNGHFAVAHYKVAVER